MSARFQRCPHCSAEFRAPPGEKLTVETNAFLQLDRHVQATHPEMLFTCRRQLESPMGIRKGENRCFWTGDNTCSYCGSISPDVFFQAIEDGCELGPTDKNYKVYVDLVEPTPDAERVVSSANFRPEGGEYLAMTPELAARFPEHADSAFIQIGRRGPVRHEKFYFQHLDEAGRDRFIELYNAGRMKLGEPGHFYQLPFFCTPAAAE